MDKITQLAKISLLIQVVVGATRYTHEQKKELYSSSMDFIIQCMDLHLNSKDMLAIGVKQDEIIKILKLENMFKKHKVDLSKLKEMTGLI